MISVELLRKPGTSWHSIWTYILSFQAVVLATYDHVTFMDEALAFIELQGSIIAFPDSISNYLCFKNYLNNTQLSGLLMC